MFMIAVRAVVGSGVQLEDRRQLLLMQVHPGVDSDVVIEEIVA